MLMNNAPFLFFLTVIGFGFWPLLGRWSGVPSPWVSSVVMAATAVVVIWIERGELESYPAARSLLLLFFAGATNAVGMVAYGRLLSTKFDPVLAPASLVVMIIVNAVASIACFGGVFTAEKWVGLLLTAVGAFLLIK